MWPYTYRTELVETMWKLTSLDIPSTHTLRSLKKAGVVSVSDILSIAEIDLRKFSEMETSEIVTIFCKNCKKLKKFGTKSKRSLALFLDAHRRNILDTYYLHAANTTSLVQELDKYDDEDFIPDLSELLPTETLLLNVTVIKGSVDYVCIEDVISDIESDILESEDDDIPEEVMREILRESFQSTNEWPADRPVYMSEYAAKVYPEIVVALSKLAVLVLK